MSAVVVLTAIVLFTIVASDALVARYSYTINA